MDGKSQSLDVLSIASDMQLRALEMIDAFVDSRGLVNYAALARSDQFEAHVKQVLVRTNSDEQIKNK